MSISPSVAFDGSSPNSPGFICTVSGLSTVVGAASVTVNRHHSDGTIAVVRGLDMTPVTGDSVVGEDYEASFIHGSFTYDFYVYSSVGATLASATGIGGDDPDESLGAILPVYPFASAIISSIQQPVLTTPMTVQNFSSWSIPGRVLSTNNVLGRKNPVVINDEFGGRAGQFVLLMNQGQLSTANLTTIQQLLEYNDVLYFRAFYEGAAFEDMYFKVTDVAVDRQTVAFPFNSDDSNFDLINEIVVFLTVSFTEVDRPSTLGETIAIATWQDILDNFATWNDVLSNRTSWLDVLNRATSP